MNMMNAGRKEDNWKVEERKALFEVFSIYPSSYFTKIFFLSDLYSNHFFDTCLSSLRCLFFSVSLCCQVQVKNYDYGPGLTEKVSFFIQKS